MPELWYAVKRLWGAVICVGLIYLMAGFAAVSTGGHLALTLTSAAAVVRWASGRWGARVFFRRHGRWP